MQVDRNNSPVHRKALFTIIICLVLLVFIETSLRLLLVVGYNASFLAPTNMIFKKYPSLEEVYFNDRKTTDPATYRILLLGASVLHSTFGDIEKRLQQKLRSSSISTLEIINLSEAAHTTRDSLIKHKILVTFIS